MAPPSWIIDATDDGDLVRKHCGVEARIKFKQGSELVDCLLPPGWR